MMFRVTLICLHCSREYIIYEGEGPDESELDFLLHHMCMPCRKNSWKVKVVLVKPGEDV